MPRHQTQRTARRPRQPGQSRRIRVVLNLSAREHDLLLAEAERHELALASYARDQAVVAAIRDRQARGESLAV